MSTPRRDAWWAPGCCERCRKGERQAAFKARRRDPASVDIKLVRALFAKFRRAPFDVEGALPIARDCRSNRAGLERLLGELVDDGMLTEARSPNGQRLLSFCPLPSLRDSTEGATDGSPPTKGAPSPPSQVGASGPEGDGSAELSDASVRAGDASTAEGDGSGSESHAYEYERVGLPSYSDIERIAALRLSDPAKHAEEVDKMLAFVADRARGGRCPAAPARILDTGGWSRRGPEAPRSGPAVAVAMLDHIWPVLDAARGTGVRLLRVSLRVPTWGALHPAAEEFLARLSAAGVAGALLSVDVSDSGEPHLYGFVLSDDRKGVIAEWLRCSGATRPATDVRTMTGWQAFASTGDPDARGQLLSLRTNLTRSTHYAFKDFPAGHGSRDLSADVLATGAFEPLWTEVLASLAPSSIHGAAAESEGDHWLRRDRAQLDRDEVVGPRRDCEPAT